MPEIADFRIQISEEDKKYKMILTAKGDDFTIEVDNPTDLLDEVDELLQERLSQYGVPVNEG